MNMNPTSTTTHESRAFQHAIGQWQLWRERSGDPRLQDRLREPEQVPAEELSAVLRLLPAPERGPVAFGLFLRAGRRWSGLDRIEYLREFLPSVDRIGRRLLEQAAAGTLRLPRRLPRTLEEFPSRVWQRTGASRLPARRATGGLLAVAAMQRLLGLHEDDVDLEDLMSFRIPSGDLPLVADLAALPPRELGKLRNRAIDKCWSEMVAGRYQAANAEMDALGAWILAGTDERAARVAKLAEHARKLVFAHRRCRTDFTFLHLRRVGRLLFRLGERGLALQCARAIGTLPSRDGWQFQPVAAATATGIRAAVLRPGGDARGWTREPALACSAMTLPLWLIDGRPRVGALVRLFQQAAACPWVLPRLQHVFQWHLLLAGRHEALREIEALAPDLAVGLIPDPNQTNP